MYLTAHELELYNLAGAVEAARNISEALDQVLTMARTAIEQGARPVLAAEHARDTVYKTMDKYQAPWGPGTRNLKYTWLWPLKRNSVWKKVSYRDKERNLSQCES